MPSIAFETEDNNSITTASGGYLISSSGVDNWSFRSDVQNSVSNSIDPYDPTDYFKFTHTSRLEKVSFNLGPLMGITSISETNDFIYTMNITPMGAFQGQRLEVVVKGGFGNYAQEWYDQWTDLATLYRETMFGNDTYGPSAHATELGEILGPIEYGLRDGTTDIDAAKKALDLILSDDSYTDFHQEIHDAATNLLAMVNGWNEQHFYLNGEEQDFFDITTPHYWSVFKSIANGYVSFSGNVATFDENFQLHYNAADVSWDWFLQVESEPAPPRQQDLSISWTRAIRTEASVGGDLEMEFKLTAANFGKSSRPDIGLYLSKDRVISTEDQLYAVFEHMRVDGNGSKTLDFVQPIWKGTKPGNYYYGAVVDYQNEIDEKNEFNNSTSAVLVHINKAGRMRIDHEVDYGDHSALTADSAPMDHFAFG